MLSINYRNPEPLQLNDSLLPCLSSLKIPGAPENGENPVRFEPLTEQCWELNGVHLVEVSLRAYPN